MVVLSSPHTFSTLLPSRVCIVPYSSRVNKHVYAHTHLPFTHVPSPFTLHPSHTHGPFTLYRISSPDAIPSFTPPPHNLSIHRFPRSLSILVRRRRFNHNHTLFLSTAFLSTFLRTNISICLLYLPSPLLSSPRPPPPPFSLRRYDTGQKSEVSSRTNWGYSAVSTAGKKRVTYHIVVSVATHIICTDKLATEI
jgi:hypothetical protein